LLQGKGGAGFELVETVRGVGGGSADTDTLVTDNFFTRKS
jgi:hypothetical protein